ncbi:phosphoenolpyruvate carboxylase [Pacificimonas sp. WHA3]|uniref:Phosphoenolpyruvate carboxylase n=1 Tax=Pacificimonas pallii TaxID=2827236 RepID=A0ABS6SCY7_9SPHN|nr:phosphoenolpyruvate carboxylase [Pacificimonas pallii]MBV7256272.1 phosphoenolpyruvate carboxylase [Pacificimonas pallii]
MNLDAASLNTRLGDLYDRTRETPLFNPVAQLGFELSRALEEGTIDLGALSAAIDAMSAAAFSDRADRLHAFVRPDPDKAAEDELTALLPARTLASFKARWERPFLGCVFTAHPTFLLADQDYAALAAGETSLGKSRREGPTLADEHGAVQAALTRAGAARDVINRRVFSSARAQFGAEWRKLRPLPFRFATWVGYDMDGRTDIDWATPIRFRMQEKVRALTTYVTRLAALDDAKPRMAELGEVLTRLRAALSHAERIADAFSQDLKTPDAISAAANLATKADPDALTRLAGVIAALEAIAGDADDELAEDILVLTSAMRAERMGVGTVHFRMNSSQLDNAIRRRLGGDPNFSMGSRTAIARLRDLIAAVKPLEVNFAALAIESTTAIRQFIGIAQMLQHIDSESAIRLLIAETEQPATVLSALYFAKLFGVDAKLDIAPLFETNEALEHGGRFLDSLLAEPAYQDYVRARGRLCIQTGFSDAGRFMGQIPAALAIERLQGRLARLMTKHGLGDVEAVIFNTHGESMGRGAHPLTMRERLSHPMSAWARRRFAENATPLLAEASFQGGDGYVFFGSEDMALATLTRIAVEQAALAPDPAQRDPFYLETDVSLDFYRDVRRVQARLFRAPSYNRALTAFGLGLLPQTGSRKSRRQTDVASDRDMTLRRIRAIPHNAILQQLGYPVNVIAGIGDATQNERERFAALYERSPRARELLRLVAASDRLASIKTLVAYGNVFNGAYWATRPYRGGEPEREAACLDLAERLQADDRTAAFRELATVLRVDGLKLRRLMDMLPGDSLPPRIEGTRRTLGVLHAIRLALMQHMFLNAAAIPRFSRRNDISRDDIMEMVLSLRIEDALEQLRAAYPVEAPSLKRFRVEEATDYPDDNTPEYGRINERYIDPIERAHRMILDVSTAIAHQFGAIG